MGRGRKVKAYQELGNWETLVLSISIFRECETLTVRQLPSSPRTCAMLSFLPTHFPTVPWISFFFPPDAWKTKVVRSSDDGPPSNISEVNLNVQLGCRGWSSQAGQISGHRGAARETHPEPRSVTAQQCGVCFLISRSRSIMGFWSLVFFFLTEFQSPNAMALGSFFFTVSHTRAWSYSFAWAKPWEWRSASHDTSIHCGCLGTVGM